MSTNDTPRLQSTPDELTRQLSAAVKRQHDLEAQLETARNDLAKLGFMQITKKVVLRAEIDNLTRKLTANQQLQEQLTRRIAEAQAQLETAAAPAEEVAPVDESAPVAEVAHAEEAAPVDEPAPVAEPAHAEEAVPVDEPIPADEPAPVAESAPVAEPAPRPARKARPAVPRKSGPRPARAAIDATLPPEEQAVQLLAHMEGYYPDHQVFAMEVLPADARALLTTLAAGAPVADFLAAHGWQQITLAQGRELRSAACPAPGSEPEIIRPRLAGVLARLERHYPDRVIARSIQHDHKALAQDVTALSAFLGYPSGGAMLTAYGFRYNVPASGRPAMDVTAVIDALKAAYAGQEKPRTIAAIAADHPQYAAILKTLQNQAPKRFGMSLRQYFRQQGLM